MNAKVEAAIKHLEACQLKAFEARNRVNIAKREELDATTAARQADSKAEEAVYALADAIRESQGLPPRIPSAVWASE